MPETEIARSPGSQTLLRGLDVLEAVKDGIIGLQDLTRHLDLTRSTTHRLATTLVERRYLAFTPRGGYRLGAKLLELGSAAQLDIDLVHLARPFIEDLAALTADTVHLGVLDGNRALYLDKIAGRRRITVSSHVGERQPLTSTGLGKALLLDDSIEQWADIHRAETGKSAQTAEFAGWRQHMETYVINGHTCDLEENEDRIRCVAAPIRDAADRIVAAISVSSAVQYMDVQRMADISIAVRAAAARISLELGRAPKPRD